MKKPVCKQANMLEKDKLTSGQFSLVMAKHFQTNNPLTEKHQSASLFAPKQ